MPVYNLIYPPLSLLGMEKTHQCPRCKEIDRPMSTPYLVSMKLVSAKRDGKVVGSNKYTLKWKCTNQNCLFCYDEMSVNFERFQYACAVKLHTELTNEQLVTARKCGSRYNDE